MAKRTLNRKELRADYDAAEGAEEEVVEESDGDAKPKKKAPAKKKTTTKKKTVKVPRRQAVWVILDNSNKPVERFAFNQREEADAALAARNEKKAGHFLQMVKEPIEES